MKLSRITVPWTDIVLICMSSTLLTLTFPRFEIEYLAWIALVPLFLAIRKSGPLKAFLLSFATGFLFYNALMWWSLRLSGLNPLSFALVSLWSSWYFAIFGLFAYSFQKKHPRWSVLTLPSAWVILEYLKSHVGFLSIPWGIMGYSQYSVLPVAGISVLTGVYGVSFLILTANIALSEIIPYCLTLLRLRGWQTKPSWVDVSTSVYLLGGIMLVFSIFVLYGFSAKEEQKELPELKVAVIQGNLYSTAQVDDELIEKVVGKYRDLSLSASAMKPELIVWPSSSVPGRIPFDVKVVSMLSDTAVQTGAFLLVGSSRFDKFSQAKKRQKRVSNSAFLLSPEGKSLGKYDKIRLLPFDQYLPLRGKVPWPSWMVSSNITDHEPGKELTVFRMASTTFGVQICWENMFPEQFRQLAAKGVDFMVSMTNEGFIDLPVAHYQLLAINVFRAIENRVSIVRPAATGVSCVIEPSGRIMARVRDSSSNDVNVEGYQIGKIPLSRERTFYTRFGDLFVVMLALILSGILIKDIITGTLQWGRVNREKS